MKNIHILPSPNPSRLLYFGTSKELTLQVNLATFRTFERSPQNIYITNDEEIKEGDWFIFYCHGITTLLKCKSINFKNIIDNEGKNCWLKYSKKIILTDNQDLIKEGVQAIDDNFLEWFVKNPSCEEVDLMGLRKEKGYEFLGYEIIFPKEEPKQENRQIGAAGFVANKIMENAISKHKQETFEEAAEKKYGTSIYDFDQVDAFIAGAKWNQERMYSEEEVKNIANWAFGFYKRNDLSDSELEDEFNRILVEQFKKK